MGVNKIGCIVLITVLSCIIFAGSISNVSAETFQTWQIVITADGGQSYTGTLNIDSSGDFTSSGLTGSTSSGSYPIQVTGWMSDTSVSLTQTASYDNGAGQISGYGQGTLNSEFPSATQASGTITGTISDPLGARGFSLSWTATRTAGGNGGSGSGLFSGSSSRFLLAAVVGVVLVVVAVSVASFSIRKGRAKRQQRLAVMDQQYNRAPTQWRESHPRNYEYQQPPPPPENASTAIPPPITMDQGIPITGQGASVVPSDLGTLPFLKGIWEKDKATLLWDTPQFNSSKYTLLGYDISQQTYGPMSTAAQNVYLGRVSAEANSTVIQPFNQTYRWNTVGDIGGYRVDPVFGQINPDGQVVTSFRYGGLSIRVGAPMGFLA